MHSRQASSPVARPSAGADDLARSRGIQRATLVAIVTNTVLTIGQVVIGLFAGAFSLVAEGPGEPAGVAAAPSR